MNDNQVISEWRGECRHEWKEYGARQMQGWYKICQKCGVELNTSNYKQFDVPDYTDPAAWDEALFDEIRKDGLVYVDFMEDMINTCKGDKGFLENDFMFELIRATPAQKAKALSKAIREGK